MGRRTPPSTAPSTVSSTIAGRSLRPSLAPVLMQPPRPPTQSHLGYPILSSSPPTSAETISSSASPPSWNQRTAGHPTTRRSREAARMIGGEPGRVPAGISLGNWLSAPYSHWSFQHVEDFVPAAVISRGTGPVAALPAASAPLAEIRLTRTNGVATTVGAVMAGPATDGWAV